MCGEMWITCSSGECFLKADWEGCLLTDIWSDIRCYLPPRGLNFQGSEFLFLKHLTLLSTCRNLPCPSQTHLHFPLLLFVPSGCDCLLFFLL